MSKLIGNRTFELWIQQFINTIVVCFLYVLFEWIFLISKRSYLDNALLQEKISTLFFGFVVLVVVCFAILLFISGFRIFTKGRFGDFLLSVSNLIPSIILACFILIFIDNFTYTIFKFGIVSSKGLFRLPYLLIFLALIFLAFRLFSFLTTLKVRNVLLKLFFLGFLLLSSLLFLPKPSNRTNEGTQQSNSLLPNIILIGSDGLSADNMSVYGYERETTPIIKDFSEQALLVENNFSNSSNTSGSIVSIFTSKYPSQTRVIYPPDLLTGEDATQHLPGILKEQGYYSAQFTLPYFADAFTLGLINGFDEVNGQPAEKNTFINLLSVGFSYDQSYFLSFIYDRISERLMHIFFIKDMLNPYALAIGEEPWIPDKDQLNNIFSLLKSHDNSPLFIHAHFFGTHGPRFYPEYRKFSTNIEQDQDWMVDYYDDSVFNFDLLFGLLIDELIQNGQIDNTIIILYSDHGAGYQTNIRTPLIIHFPNGKFQGTIIHQGENLSIAPTIIDYLQIEIPVWMSGESLLSTNTDKGPVISLGTNQTKKDERQRWVLDENSLTPPFFQFDVIGLVDCQKWYQVDLNSYTLAQGNVDNYRNPCPQENLLTQEEVIQIIVDRLLQDGFDVPEEYN